MKIPEASLALVTESPANKLTARLGLSSATAPGSSRVSSRGNKLPGGSGQGLATPLPPAPQRVPVPMPSQPRCQPRKCSAGCWGGEGLPGLRLLRLFG